MENRSIMAENFYIDDHALIYGLMGKYAEALCGEAGMDALAKGTVQYAKERGLRMAKRCLADGRELSMQSYLLYAEWADTRGWTGIEVSGIVPKFLNHVEKCAWHIAWKQYDLMRYGAVYCTWVDKNLVKGFNPENEVVIDSVLTHGAPSCEFDWLGADFASEQEFYDLFSPMADRVFVEKVVPIWGGKNNDICMNKYGRIFPRVECCSLLFHTLDLMRGCFL